MPFVPRIRPVFLFVLPGRRGCAVWMRQFVVRAAKPADAASCRRSQPQCGFGRRPTRHGSRHAGSRRCLPPNVRVGRTPNGHRGRLPTALAGGCVARLADTAIASDGGSAGGWCSWRWRSSDRLLVAGESTLRHDRRHAGASPEDPGQGPEAKCESHNPGLVRDGSCTIIDALYNGTPLTQVPSYIPSDPTWDPSTGAVPSCALESGGRTCGHRNSHRVSRSLLKRLRRRPISLPSRARCSRCCSWCRTALRP